MVCQLHVAPYQLERLAVLILGQFQLRSRSLFAGRPAALTPFCAARKVYPTEHESIVPGQSRRGVWWIEQAIYGSPFMSESPHLNISQHKDVAVVEFVQNKILDEMNITEIGQALVGLVEGHDRPRLLLDFSNVDHLSSAALGMLININNKIKQTNGQLRLCNIKPQIMEVFVITKLNRLFRIAVTRQEAQGSFE